MTDSTLREHLNQKLDFFTEPGQGEKHLKDLEDDLVELFERHSQEIAREAQKDILMGFRRRDFVSDDFYETAVLGALAELTQKPAEGTLNATPIERKTT